MKMMRIVVLCSALSVFFLTSCFKGSNTDTFATTNAVVSYYDEYPGMTFLQTYHGLFAAPTLNEKGYQEGDCMFASFSIDKGHQPTKNYYTLSDLNKIDLKKADIVMLNSNVHDINDTIAKLSVDSIKSVVYPPVDVYCIANNLFLGFGQFNTDISYEYQLVYSDLLIDKVPVLYICAKESSKASTISIGGYQYQAFDLTSFLARYADDENKFSFYLRFKKGVDANGENEYASWEIPITLGNWYWIVN